MSLRADPFIQDAATGRSVTVWWAAIIVFLGLFAFQLAVMTALAVAWPGPDGSPAAQVQEAVANLLTIGLLFTWIAWFERRRIATLGLRRPGRGLLVLLLGVAVGLAMISVPILFLWATGSYQTAPAPQDATAGAAALPLVVALTATVIAQGANEELLTRGFLFQSFAQGLPGWLAIGLGAVIFALVHGVVEPLPFATITLYALFATFTALALRSLWLVCGIHAGWNFGMGNVYGIPVSGSDPQTASLVFLAPAPGSADWLTGGDFGTEGGLPAALTLLAATAIACTRWQRQRRAAAAGDTPAAAPTMH
ncbi:CPBP family intramembrane glutamic endopeptidase [Glycomyces terrestris]|uniref:CPBP family intramembrane metalloprotease n=1 Tax=Glycomyces terrestris TaxID=2493553 RepID=A0A426UUH1_9ACTN|nr:type II CAAX endopeptidase family protein [Glycomyces terrestris]RRR97509.1 CPBP family intramembrane metalloprotease [Glycomyces terrestris]